MRFRFVEKLRGAFPIDRLCRVMNVGPRGLRFTFAGALPAADSAWTWSFRPRLRRDCALMWAAMAARG